MAKSVYEKLLKIRYSEMDYDLMLKPSALLGFLQDLASENAEQLGFGYSFVSKNNLAWFLLKYHMEFENYPKNLYDLRILTEPRGYNKLFAFRDFELLDGENVIARITSTWSLVDLNSKNIVQVGKILEDNQNMVIFEKRENDLHYEKINLPEKINSEKEFEVRFEDIDVNGHANNANYIIWAFETLGFEFRSANRLKTLDIIFKKEIKYGDKVMSQAEICGNETRHILKSVNTGEDLCLISAKWISK